jgi:hypothetical protein
MIFDLRSALIISASIVPRGTTVNLLNLARQRAARMGEFKRLGEKAPIAMHDYAQF